MQMPVRREDRPAFERPATIEVRPAAAGLFDDQHRRREVPRVESGSTTASAAPSASRLYIQQSPKFRVRHTSRRVSGSPGWGRRARSARRARHRAGACRPAHGPTRSRSSRFPAAAPCRRSMRRVRAPPTTAPPTPASRPRPPGAPRRPRARAAARTRGRPGRSSRAVDGVDVPARLAASPFRAELLAHHAVPRPRVGDALAGAGARSRYRRP